VGAKILTLRQNKHAKRTTLNPDYRCDECGEPAMTQEEDRLRCPSCWLKEQGQRIKPIDRGGYRP
tara:strand:+ start:217 stop:411 length:195 start_codon:yes stop_codon:yes gene_type:complete